MSERVLQWTTRRHFRSPAREARLNNKHIMTRFAAFFFLITCVAQAAAAGEYKQFPGAPTDSRTLNIQDRIESIFSSGDYARALLIYEKELAPLGDKYAQYMVGYMHLNGKGVAENPAEAYAWYRLAAERGEPEFIMARDALRETLDPAQLEQANSRFAELWQRYGDRKLILDLISRDLEALRRAAPPATGVTSAIDEDGSAGITIVASGYSNGPHDLYYRRIKARLEERLNYLPSTKDAEEAGIADPAVIEQLEAKVRQDLKALDLP